MSRKTALGEELDIRDVVVIVKGKHAGRVGVYDDDMESGAIVVLPNLYYGAPVGVPGGWERLTVRPSSVRLATELEEARWRKHAREIKRQDTEGRPIPAHLKGD